MAREFTAEEFEGYIFKCSTEDASTGFKHVCRVYKGDEEILKTSINWGNRTWESYMYQSVFESAKAKLKEKLENPNEEELDLDILNRLCNAGLLYNYGEDEEGDTYILADGWSEVDENSVWGKLVKLAEKNLLKPSVNRTVLALKDSYLFTDEYGRCEHCGKIYSHYWGDLRILNYEWVCYNCINENTEYLQDLVLEAREDFKKAVPATVTLEALSELGYVPIGDVEEPFSLSNETWGEKRWGYSYAPTSFLEEICERYYGFAKLESVQQFDSPFYIMVPKGMLEEANADLASLSK